MEGNRVPHEALGCWYIKYHDLQHADAKGALKCLGPAPHVLRERGEGLERAQAPPVPVKVDDIRQLFLGESRLCGTCGGHGSWGDVRPVVIQEGAHVQQMGRVHALLLELPQRRHYLGRLADVALQHEVRDAVLAQVHRRRQTGLLIEVDADHRERVLGKDLSTSSAAPDMLVDLDEQVPIPTTCVSYKFGLGIKLVPREDGINVTHHVLEESLVLCPAANNVQSPLDVNLGLGGVLADTKEAPACILHEHQAEVGEHGRVGGGHVERVATLQRQRALRRDMQDTLRVQTPYAQLLENPAQEPTRVVVHLREVKGLHAALLAHVQPLLAPPGEVRDGGEQRRQDDAIEQNGQQLALRFFPVLALLGPSSKAMGRLLGRQSKGRCSLGVNAPEGFRSGGLGPKERQQLPQLRAGHQGVGPGRWVERDVPKNAAGPQEHG
mmetsp:Transcript_42808/g.122088  ORF Transcript_42808/g.122088 Transcript_42808/m.122088 type:complete len:438 (-) Transcript_42808:253-1566(-)